MTSEVPQQTLAIIYEAMSGATRQIAESIGHGMGTSVRCLLIPIGNVQDLVGDIDALVVGGPTHVHGLSRPETRS